MSIIAGSADAWCAKACCFESISLGDRPDRWRQVLHAGRLSAELVNVGTKVRPDWRAPQTVAGVGEVVRGGGEVPFAALWGSVRAAPLGAAVRAVQLVGTIELLLSTAATLEPITM